MEAQGNLDGDPSNAIGLGFNLPQEHLKLINWNTKSQASGVWNNQQDGSGSSTPLYLPGLEKVNLTFESVALFIRAGTPNLILKVADISGKKTDDLSSDLSFYVSANEAEPIANEVESPSGLSFGIKNQPFGPKPMILWFEFH
jgi:hypothetical protein